MKKLLGCFLLAILCLLPAGTVFAAEQPDFDKSGSIDIYMRATDGNLIKGGSIEVHKVADVKKTAKGYQYVYTDDYAASGYSLEQEDIADLVAGLHDYTVDHAIQGVTYANTTGHIKLDAVTVGLYLIDSKQAPPGYREITPFLVAMPYRLGEDWIYEVDASPKMNQLMQPIFSPGHMPDSDGNPGGDPDSEWGVNGSGHGSNTNSSFKSPATGEEAGTNWGMLMPVLLLGAAAGFARRTRKMD